MREPAPFALRPCALACPPSSVLARGLNGLQATHVILQYVRHRNRATLLLISLHHRDERAADGDAGSVQRVDVAYLTAALGAVARVHAPGLKLAAQRAGGNLAIGVL